MIYEVLWCSMMVGIFHVNYSALIFVVFERAAKTELERDRNRKGSFLGERNSLCIGEEILREENDDEN